MAGLNKAYKRRPSMVSMNGGPVLCLDAGSKLSYPGTGTTWTDLSGNGNHGTLINGPTYDSANGGSLVFNGTNQYISAGNGATLSFTNSLTIMCWLSSSNLSSYRSPLMKTTTSNWNDGFGFYQYLNQFAFFVNQWNGSFIASISKLSFSNTHYAGVYDGSNLKLYENGILVSSGSSYTSNIVNSNAPLWIGSGGLSLSSPSYYWGGKISNTNIYNRALSAAEISTNFELLRGRYGI